ncbi:MAG: tetratricopeptide repeat protein, partial [Halothece sp.]
DYDRALELNPEQARIYLNRGIAYTKQENLEQAIADYTQAIELNASLADAYANRGVVHYLNGDQESAIADLEMAAEIYQEEGKESLYEEVQNRIQQLQSRRN